MGHKEHKDYWQRLLLPGENIVYTFGISRWYITFFWVFPFLLMLVLVGYLTFVNVGLAMLLGMVALGLMVPALYMAFFVHFCLTEKRVMSREGIFHINFITADLRSVTDISVSESFFERIITWSGDVKVNTAGSDIVELVFRHVSRPHMRKNDVYKYQAEARDKYGGVINRSEAGEIDSEKSA